MPKDPYETLGVPKSASIDDIKRAYRKLSKELHPDRTKGDATSEQKYKEVNEAYEILSDPNKRKRYDQFGAAGMGGAGGGFGGFGGGFNAEDLGGFSDIFETFFNSRGGNGRRGSEKGSDLQLGAEVTLEEVLTGVKRTVNFQANVQCDVCKGNGAAEGSTLNTCKECNGTGQVTRTAQSFFGAIRQVVVCPTCQGAGKIPEKPCGNCKGEGRLREQHEVTVDIPAGIHDGQTLRVRGEGEAGRRGAPSGDLFIEVSVSDHPLFIRQGDDTRSTYSLPLLEAILGEDISVPTLHGKVTLRIPEGTQPGQVFRLKGKGLPVLNTSRVGDHYVEMQVEIPKKLSRAERKLVEEWKNL